MATFSYLNFICFLSILLDLCSGSAIWNFNGTIGVIRPTENNIHEVNLYQNLVYHQKVYSKLYISKDGMVGFTSSIEHKDVDFSGPNVSPFVDLPFIAPYYFEAQDLQTIRDYTGRVYYHQLNVSSTDPDPVYPSVKYLGAYLRSQAVGSDHFYPDWALQVTWANVSSKDEILRGTSNCQGTVSNPCQMNTFQLVLLSDGVDSYAIFNYGDMNLPVGRFDQAGFNGGAGMGWFGVLEDNVKLTTSTQLTGNQGSDLPGRYIFKISSANIVRGGCSKSPVDTQLTVYPTFAGMFGGKMIDISGPCFNPSSNNVRCQFGNSDPVKPVNVSRIRARCLVPHLTERGIISLALSVNGGNSFPYKTSFTIVHPSRLPYSEHLIPDIPPWYDYRANQIKVEWAPALLSLTSSAMVDISLIGYREINGQTVYKKLVDIASVRVDSTQYTFDSDSKQCSGEDCFDFELGIFEVRLRPEDLEYAAEYGFQTSSAVPLGWFVRQAMESRHGSNWQSTMCMNWYNRDKQNTAWLQGLLSCPCSLSQALADFGRFQPDTGCSITRSDSVYNCVYHKGASHCVRSVQPVLAAGNQCCYNNVTGSLMFAADTFQGSTPDRSHTWGAAPYGMPDYVPSLSHWIHDVVSYSYCCVWTDLSPDCDHYMDLRPTKDCTGYTPPKAASIFGQGHVMSYTGYNYRMFGPGDYVLATAGKTIIQGRFERNPVPTENNYTVTSTVALTAVAIMGEGTSKVEIRLRIPPANRERQRLDVRVDGKAIVFDNRPMRWQDFKGVTVVNTDRVQSTQSNFTVIMTNGIGFQVAELQNSNVLQLDLVIPSDTFTNVNGLFGDLSGNMRASNGTFMDLLALSKSTVYNSFQLSWAVNETNNLFVDYLPANHSLLGQVIYNPSELPEASSVTARNFCGSDKLCYFDYMHTNSMILAKSTHQATKRFAYLTQSLQPVRSCGILNVPRATKSSYEYVLGTTTTITGCRTGALSGEATYTCVETSNVTQAWSPDITATCEVATEKADVGMIIGIVIAVVVVLAIALIIAVIAMRKRRKSVNKRSGEPQSEKEMETLKTHA